MPPRPQVAIADPSLTVEPGRRVSTRVRVRNTGRQVAHYRLTLVPGCEPAAWATIPNPEVKLNPGADADVLVHFEPPLDTRTRAGTFPYGIRIQPGPDDGQLPMVGEADLTVGAITAIDVRLTPRRSAGRFSGKHRVLLDNRGTEDLQVRLRAFDDDEALSAAVVPQTVNVPAGGSGEALLRVRPRTPSVLGKPRTLPFHVAYRRRAGGSPLVGGPTDGGEVEATVDGTFDHKPLLSRLVLAALALLAAVAGFALWRALQPAEPEPGPPPASPQGFAATQLGGGLVQLAWVTDANVATVRLRTIDCATAQDPIPQVVNPDLGEVEVSGTRSLHQVGPFEPGLPVCFQARSVTDDGAVSVWTPEPQQVVLGDEGLPSPAGLAVEPGDQPGTATASWEPVELDGEVRYDLVVDGRSLDPNGITTTTQTLTGLAAGEHQVQVRTMFDGELSPLEEPATVTITEGAGAEGGAGGGAGGDAGGGGGGGQPPGGGTGTGGGGGGGGGAPVVPEGHFVVILPVGASGPGQVTFVWDVARRGDPDVAGDEAFPEAEQLVVDETVSLPGLPLPAGQPVVLQDGFRDPEEIVTRCETYLAVVARLIEEGAAGPTSGLGPTCRAFAPVGG